MSVTAMQSMSGNDFECLARTGANTPGIIFPSSENGQAQLFHSTARPQSSSRPGASLVETNCAYTMALTSGTKLGPYEIQSPLGAGGVGEVYRARDTRLDRIVAIKILPAAFASDPDRLLRFQQEARVLSALNHPNLLTIFDVGNQDGSYYLVCELLEGDTLRERLNVGPLPLRGAEPARVSPCSVARGGHQRGLLRTPGES